MKRVLLAVLRGPGFPDGYKDDVLGQGTVQGEFVELEEAVYAELSRKWLEPSFPAMLANFAGATARWVAAGFPLTTEDQFKERLAICQGCEFWTGTNCRRCGCRKLKLHWRTEACPIRKWLAIERKGG
jgi:hypothetical protein